jgi:hypothetical protein
VARNATRAPAITKGVVSKELTEQERALMRQAEEARDAVGLHSEGWSVRGERRTVTAYAKDGEISVGVSGSALKCAENGCGAIHGPGGLFTQARQWQRRLHYMTGEPTRELVWREKPICINCQLRYERWQFPADATFAEGGRWYGPFGLSVGGYW